MKIRQILFEKILRQRVCYMPTWRGWLLLLVAVASALFILLHTVQPFLAKNSPLVTDVLVVEGWLPDDALQDAAAEFARGHYRKLYVTGGPLQQGSYLAAYKTHAELGAMTLHQLGISKDRIVAVSAPFVQKDRTIASAMTLRDMLQRQPEVIAEFNLVSMGVHARRSQHLFQSVFAPDTRVGVIAVDDHSYAAEAWWKSSQGVRTVLGESVAWLYAVLVYPLLG